MRHLDTELLLMVLAGHVPPRKLLKVMYDHLKELCPECRANLEAVAQELDWTLLHESPDGSARDGGAEAGTAACCAPSATAQEQADPEDSYAAAFRRAGAATLSGTRRILEERTAAQRDLEELLALPADRRRDRVRRARTRFRSRWLAQLLVGECLAAVRRDPADAQDLAELVPLVLQRIPGALDRAWGEELYARALAHRGNALRVQNAYAAADATFFELHRFLAARSLESEDLHPEILSLEASLRDNQYRFAEALELLDRALAAARELGDDQEVARYLVQRSAIRRADGDLAGSREDQQAAMALLHPDHDRHLYLCALFGYGHNLCATGEYDAAEALVAENRPLAVEHGEDWLLLQVESLQARIDRGLGRIGQAEERLLEARQRYVELDRPYDAAYLSLDLAEIYLEQGRHQELARTTSWLARVFDVSGVKNEALVALALFQRAVAQEEVSREMVGRLRQRLEQLDQPKGPYSLREVHLPS